jgi:hypothetical protein
MVIDQLGLLFPADPRVLELAYPLLLLGIDTDNGVGLLHESSALAVNIGKLSVAHRARGRVFVA